MTKRNYQRHYNRPTLTEYRQRVIKKRRRNINKKSEKKMEILNGIALALFLVMFGALCFLPLLSCK